MFSKILFAIFLSLLAGTAVALDFGFGASFKSSESSIFLPVRISDNLMIEPYFRYRDSDTENATFKTSTEDLTAGMGIFGLVNPIENASVYIGIRAAYVESERKNSPIGFFTFPVAALKVEQDGFSVAPTLGFEYLILQQLTIGAEVAWEYKDLDGTTSGASNNPNIPAQNADTEDTGTRTNIILRFYF